MGCGRVGSRLARTLDELGHSVAVIDQNVTSFARLGTAFEGKTVQGIGFDRDALESAGIPYTAFKFAENNGQFQVIREQSGTFADSIKLWSDA